ncbi:MAG: hypothetical protein M0R22_06330 [Dehalococcoidia bacterium]|jgi:hypothetical protein|nr:hypothetical protein [Dehalococcoidia bacterium]
MANFRYLLVEGEKLGRIYAHDPAIDVGEATRLVNVFAGHIVPTFRLTWGSHFMYIGWDVVHFAAHVAAACPDLAGCGVWYPGKSDRAAPDPGIPGVHIDRYRSQLEINTIADQVTHVLYTATNSGMDTAVLKFIGKRFVNLRLLLTDSTLAGRRPRLEPVPTSRGEPFRLVIDKTEWSAWARRGLRIATSVPPVGCRYCGRPPPLGPSRFLPGCAICRSCTEDELAHAPAVRLPTVGRPVQPAAPGVPAYVRPTYWLGPDQRGLYAARMVKRGEVVAWYSGTDTHVPRITQEAVLKSRSYYVFEYPDLAAGGIPAYEDGSMPGSVHIGYRANGVPAEYESYANVDLAARWLDGQYRGCLVATADIAAGAELLTYYGEAYTADPAHPEEGTLRMFGPPESYPRYPGRQADDPDLGSSTESSASDEDFEAPSVRTAVGDVRTLPTRMTRQAPTREANGDLTDVPDVFDQKVAQLADQIRGTRPGRYVVAMINPPTDAAVLGAYAQMVRAGWFDGTVSMCPDDRVRGALGPSDSAGLVELLLRADGTVVRKRGTFDEDRYVRAMGMARAATVFIGVGPPVLNAASALMLKAVKHLPRNTGDEVSRPWIVQHTAADSAWRQSAEFVYSDVGTFMASLHSILGDRPTPAAAPPASRTVAEYVDEIRQYETGYLHNLEHAADTLRGAEVAMVGELVGLSRRMLANFTGANSLIASISAVLVPVLGRVLAVGADLSRSPAAKSLPVLGQVMPHAVNLRELLLKLAAALPDPEGALAVARQMAAEIRLANSMLETCLRDEKPCRRPLAPERTPAIRERRARHVGPTSVTVACDRLAELMRDPAIGRFVLVVIGAGISQPVIPTYRGQGSMGMLTPSTQALAGTVPTVAHAALARLLCSAHAHAIISQNVDGLEIRAIEEVAPGSARDWIPSVVARIHVTLGGAPLKIGESIPEPVSDLAESFAQAATLAIVIGTSLSISTIHKLVGAIRDRFRDEWEESGGELPEDRLWFVNPDDAALAYFATHSSTPQCAVRASADIFLPELYSRFSGDLAC